MFEVLLSLCLAGQPADCRTERLPGGDDDRACMREADRLRAAPPSGSVAQDWPCVQAGETPGFRVTEIAPGVFVHKGRHAEANPDNRGDLANIGFIVGEQAVAVIDAGGSAGVARALLRAIRARTDLPVRWLILTHMHPDHTLGASVFAEAGAEILGHPNLPLAMAARADFYLTANRRLIGAAFEGTTAPTKILPAPAELDLGDRILKLDAHATAHTDNDLTILDTTTGTRFLGDLLFIDHLPAVDGSIRGWLSVLEMNDRLDAVRVVPGHGPVAVDWPGDAVPMRDYFDGLVQQVREGLAGDRSMLDMVEEAESTRDPRWLLFEAFHPRNITVVYQELEWE